MWVVTFYKTDAEPVEVVIKEAKTRIHAIVAASNEKPEILESSDDVDALEVPDLEGGPT